MRSCGGYAMGQFAYGRAETANRRADPQGCGIPQAIAVSRHARADGEEVSRLKPENRPTGDDLLDREDAIAERKLLLDFAVHRQRNLERFLLASLRLDEHCRSQRCAGWEVLSE